MGFYIPVTFFLLSDKSEKTYKRMCDLIKPHCDISMMTLRIRTKNNNCLWKTISWCYDSMLPFSFGAVLTVKIQRTRIPNSVQFTWRTNSNISQIFIWTTMYASWWGVRIVQWKISKGVCFYVTEAFFDRISKECSSTFQSPCKRSETQFYRINKKT